MAELVHTIEVLPKTGGGMADARGESIRRQLSSDHGLDITEVRSTLGYLVKGDLSPSELARSTSELFSDPIIEDGLANTTFIATGHFETEPDLTIIIGFKPGVTDNRAQAALDGLQTLFPDKDGLAVATTTGYMFWGLPGDVDADWLSNQLYNQMIERVSISSTGDAGLEFPERPPTEYQPPATVNLEVSDEELNKLSQTGLLALNLKEMKAIQSHYRDPEVQTIRQSYGISPRAPTDVELECLAQTWSEHCSHKIFAAKIHHIDTETGEDSTIDSLFKTHIMKPTFDIRESADWLLSLFHDNSGVIEWTEDWSLCMKAETHNSPSALDPFGGAITGIVGVNRDILGTGLGARPIANTDIFCFGPPDYDGDLPQGLFHPSRVFRGVHAGVRAGGNESGIPTVNGAMIFDDRYIGKPLVYCGTVGIMPRLLPDGRESHIKTPSPGDIIYMVGGKVGSDGIHGATFSSMELTEESPSSAVQIGDPITQKKMIDMLLAARDAGLIQVITDNGAGGLSSSVGEMAELTNGAELDLSTVPLKQPGLSPWEILVSESQERMTVGLLEEDTAAFEALAELHEVEATRVGRFTDDGIFLVRFGDQVVAHLPITFLYDGCPQLQLESEWTAPEHPLLITPYSGPFEMGEILTRIMARPNVASKEWWVRSYDHEVIAQSVIKPFCGVNHDAPSDAAVIAPIIGEVRGAVISNGIVPRYSDIDTYAMVAASIDEALRNAVCVGVDLDKMAGLDNFCWCDPIESEKTPDGRYKLAQLVRANRALDDVCRAYHLPCISGKDSMKNDAIIDGEKISIPPTLLFSLLGNHHDVRKAVSSDFKNAGDLIYLLGESHQELGASELAFMFSEEAIKSYTSKVSGQADDICGIGGTVPAIDAERNITMYRSLTGAMREVLVASAHDCSDGGLAVALAECCIGISAGCEVDITAILAADAELDHWGALFGESLGRILVSIIPENQSLFEVAMAGHSATLIGMVNRDDDDNFTITANDEEILVSQVGELRSAWQGTLDGGQPE
jgi:phosphoribosylformylglycinamidine synthase